MTNPRVLRAAVLALVAAALAAAAAAPSHAGARGRGSTATPCPSWSGVKSFHGTASSSFSATATGSVPGAGGTETIGLSRHASGLKVDLSVKRVSQIPGYVGITLFAGKVHGGSVSVADTLTNSGSSSNASAHANGTSLPGAVMVVLWPKTCTYQLGLSFAAHTIFSGDAALDPGDSANAQIFAPRRHVPASSSLKLGGSAQVNAYQTGCSVVDIPFKLPDVDGCYQFGGGWSNDFATLVSCKSIVAVNCGPADEEMGNATVSWSLKPTF